MLHGKKKVGNRSALIEPLESRTLFSDVPSAVAPPILHLVAKRVTVEKDQTFSGVVATLNDSDATAPLSEFSPNRFIIQWGDGKHSAATNVTEPGGAGNPFLILGRHMYKHVGAYRVKVLLPDASAGSTLVHRLFTDTNRGEVYIYSGGLLPQGVTATTFSLFANKAGLLTPLLLEETANGQFTIRGVGTTRTITRLGAQSFPFGLQSGGDFTTSGKYTFGFVNAQADSAGNLTGASTGVIAFSDTPAQGQGMSGPTSNNHWIYTYQLRPQNVAIGTAYGNGGFTVNPGVGYYRTDRTYSANITFTAGVSPANAVAQVVITPPAITSFRASAGSIKVGELETIAGTFIAPVSSKYNVTVNWGDGTSSHQSTKHHSFRLSHRFLTASAKVSAFHIKGTVVTAGGESSSPAVANVIVK